MLVLLLLVAVVLLLVGGAALLAHHVPASRAPLTVAAAVATLLTAVLGVVADAGTEPEPAPTPVSATAP
nr:hypothetical protein [Streptomyces sp. SID4945]